MEYLFQHWEEIKQQLREEHELSDISYKTWIKPLELYQANDNVVTILVSLEGSLDYIRNKYTLPFQVIITEMTGKEYRVEFISPEMASTYSPHEEKLPAPVALPDGASPLNPKYTFDTFVVGKNNEFAHAAALAVAENPGEIYNPLFLYGGAGLGKTHLMHSIAYYILEKFPEKRVMFVTSESFTNQLIDAIRVGKSGDTNSMAEFREKYRNIDVLLIDDIQFIIGKESTQEEFFHTFNDLYGARKAIIITSDKPPKDFDTLEERYRTRFEWGITADINPPDFETRMAILRKKEELDNLTAYHIPNEVFEFIASTVKSNIRELEGAFNKLVALARLNKMQFSLEIAQKAVQDMVTPKEERKVTKELIMDIVADHYQVSIDDIISPKRNSELVIPRHVTIYLCRRLTAATLTDLGIMLGNRNHTTIRHADETIAEAVKHDETMANTIDILIKKINPK